MGTAYDDEEKCSRSLPQSRTPFLLSSYQGNFVNQQDVGQLNDEMKISEAGSPMLSSGYGSRAARNSVEESDMSSFSSPMISSPRYALLASRTGLGNDLNVFASPMISSPHRALLAVRQSFEGNDVNVYASPMISCPHYELLAARRNGISPRIPIEQQKDWENLKQTRTNGETCDFISSSTQTDSAAASLTQMQIPSLEDYASFNNSNSSDNDRKESSSSKMASEVCINIMYGMINTTIILPVIMSFGKIIYIDDAFQPYLPLLVKLTLFSGMVHQFCFSTFSSLPFAIGQVQDAGLIFLSQMASNIVTYVIDYVEKNPEIDEEDTDKIILATSLVGLAIATAVLGCFLILIGKLKLAQYVQLLPTSVVGGYLAYIGWFCGTAGIGIMAGSSVLTIPILTQKWLLIIPGLLGGAFIYVSVLKIRHMVVLPSCIVFLLFIFYMTLYLTNTSITEATDYGWIAQSDAPPIWYHSWAFFHFDKVVWSALPQLIFTELGMIFVVAISSSLDVAAIELELKEPLDYNHEIMTVGLSNLISGLTGGYTGSYIFSQTNFSQRAGIRSRINGYVVGLIEILVLVLPFNVLAYVPSFFFGSLLVMICIDLLYEWLYLSYANVTNVEYIICWITFFSIQVAGVEYGILLGGIVFFICYKIGMDVEVKVATFDST